MGADVRNWQGCWSGTRYPATASTEGWTDVFQQMGGRSFLLQTQMHLHRSCVDPRFFIWRCGPTVLNKDIAGLLLFLGLLSPGNWAVSWMWPLEIPQRCSGTQQQGLGDSWRGTGHPQVRSIFWSLELPGMAVQKVGSRFPQPFSHSPVWMWSWFLSLKRMWLTLPQHKT